MTEPAVGYTSGDDRKVNKAGDDLTGPLSWESLAEAHVIESRVTGDAEVRFTVENDGTLAWGNGTDAPDVTLYRGDADVLRTDDQLHLGNTGSVKFGASGDVDITRSGVGELTVDGDLVVTGAITGVDPLDQDLVDIGNLAPADNDVLQRKSGAWTNRTPAQVKTDLALSKGDVGLGNVTNDAQIPKSLVDAKGDLLVGSANDTVIRVPVGGTTGHVLKVNPATSSGVEWGPEAAAASDPEITALAALTSAADKVPYYTGPGTAALADLTAFARTLLDDGDAVMARGTLGVLKGVAGGVQQYDDDLQAIAGLTPSNDDVIQRKSGAWTNRTVAQLRTDLGVTPIPMPGSSWYFFPAGSAAVSTSNGVTNNHNRVVPWVVRSTMTIIRMGIEVTVAGQAGSTFRLGIYSGGGGWPSSLVLDAGTVPTDAVGTPEVTVSQVLDPGVYFVGGAHQGAATTPATFRTISTSWTPPIDLIISSALPAAGTQAYGYATGGVTGALPASFGGLGTTASAVRIFMRAT